MSIAAKIYNALQRNCIEPKIDNILKNQNGFWRNRSMMSQILTVEFLKVYVQKTYRQQYLLTLLRPLTPFTEDGANSSRLPKETVAAIMMLIETPSKSQFSRWRQTTSTL